MSERTTIGGTVYESVGSSSSNLLLKCNGTARIQWGSKLIDLIKNGKIASENSSSPIIFNVKDESEIKLDGVYILTKDENTLIIICKDKNKYDITSAKLYIAADTEQSLTSDLKKCALFNIGAYYNTYSDLELAGVKDGIVYVMDTKTLYTVLNGIIEEFEAKLKTISIKESETSNVINDSVQIVLSINDLQYLVLTDGMITANQSIHIHPAALIGSEGANSSQGYRLFIDGGISVLEVDEIRVRRGVNELSRGMIIMHSGITPIPEGWAICDGGTYKYNGEEITTPNLVGRFIKAVTDVSTVGEINNSDLVHTTEIVDDTKVTTWTNLLQIQPEHLPEHQHKFSADVSGLPNSLVSSVTYNTDNLIIPQGDLETSDILIIANMNVVDTNINGAVAGNTKILDSSEDYTNNIINIEPQAYALIFIMKL